MADEAVVRIVVTDGGRSGGSAPSTGGGSAPTTATTSPTAPGGFDPVAIAQKRIEREEQQEAVDAAYAKLKPPPLPVPPPIFDPVEIARKRVEREEQQELIDAEYAKMRPPEPPPPDPVFDPVEVARKRVEREQQMAAVEAEYAKMVPITAELAFDPVEAAKKRLEKEQQKAAIDAEYAKLNPKEEPSAMDNLLKMLASVRGTVGGMGGGLIGAGLDIYANMKDVQDKKSKGGGIPKVPNMSGGGTAGGGGSQMAGAEAAAGAIPVVAIALAAKEAAQMINQSIVSGIKNVIGGAGSIARGIASADTDVSKPIAALGDASSAAGEKLNELVPGLGNALIVVGEAQKAFASLMQAIDQTANRYAEFSPELASAQAMAEVRQTMGDLRRSREVGPELARYIIAQSDMQQKFEDIKVKLLTRLLPIVTNILKVLEAVVPSGEGIEKAVTTVGYSMGAIPAAIMAIVSMLKENNVELPKDPTDQLRFDKEFMNVGEGVRADPGLVPRR